MTITDTGGNNESFFQEYFIKPIIEKTGYNIINTLVYGFLLVIGAYALYKLLKKLGYEINYRFLKASIPFILLASVWRALTDAGVYPYTFFTTTPGLYAPLLMLFIPVTIFAKHFEKKNKIKYEKIYSGIPTILLISQLIILAQLMTIQLNIDAIGKLTYFVIISTAPVILLSKYWKTLKNKLNLLMIITHFIDASATHVSLTYFNYFEQHVIPNLFFDIFNTSMSFYLLKVIVLLPVIQIIDSKETDKELSNYVKIIFITFGIATGIRGSLRLILGV